MRGAVPLAAILLALPVLGCATKLEIAYDEGQDFSGYRTWGWLPKASSVDAIPGEESMLGSLTLRLVEDGLGRRGLEHSDDHADLLVGFDLRVRRQLVATNETGAEQLLSSLNSTPSYWVQSTSRRYDIYDSAYLRLVFTDGARERVVWSGEIWTRRRGRFDHHLAEAVSRLLDRLPAAVRGAPAPPAAPPGGST